MANLGLQNNNPGNIKDPATGAFRTFDTPEQGHQALIDDIKLKQSGGSAHIKPGASLEDFANVWAPKSDNNDPKNYALTLAKFLGVPVAEAFDQVPPEKLAAAVKVAEGTTALPDGGTSSQKLSVDAFAAKIKAKYPGSYDDMDNNALTQKILAKYPQYADMVEAPSSISTPTAPAPNPSFTGLNLGGTPNEEGQSTSATSTASTVNDIANVGKGLVSGTIESGKDIAAAIGGNTMAKTFEALPEADQNYLTTLIQLRNKAATAGNKDEVTHFQNLIKTYKTSDGQSITDVFPALNKSAEQVIGDFASMGLETVGLAEGASGLLTKGAAVGTEEATKSFGKRLLSAAGTGFGYGAGFGTTGAMENNASGVDVLKSGVIGGVTGAVVGAGTEAISTGIKALSGGGKTAEEVLATPEEDVDKLSPREQKFWHSNQATEATAAAKEAGAQSLEEVNTKLSDLQQQVGSVTREKALSLKEPSKQLLKDMSAEYVDLTGEAVDGNEALSKTVSSQDLVGKIDSKFEYTPDIGEKLKMDLGLGGEDKTITNQEILDKAREIMQSVSKSAKAGGSVYSPAEYEAMQKYSFLMETLGDNGVDMSEANAFWKKWAPLRNKIVSQVKPWDEAALGGTPVARTMITASSPASTARQVISKAEAQNFLSEFEKALKVPAGTLTNDTQSIVDQLEAAKLSKEETKQATEEILTQIREGMKSKKYDLASAAAKSKFVKGIVRKVIATAVGAGVGHAFGKGTPATIAGAVTGELLLGGRQ